MYSPTTTPCILSDNKDLWDGYSRVTIKKANGRSISVGEHRLMYAKSHNMSLADMKHLVVMHKCDVRNCVNPEHLILGTVAMNNKDKQDKGRNVTHFVEGNQFAKLGTGNTRLTEEQVIEIRARWQEAQTALAKEFNVTQAAISGILLRKTWKHI
jgi:hypothetical protein